MYVDEKGTIHLAWTFRESSDASSNANLYYAYSEDEGVNWRRKSDGSLYTLPITPNTTGNSASEIVWNIPQGSNLMNQCNMTADADGNPYILTYFGNPTIQYRVIYNTGSGWQMSQVSNRTTIDDSGGHPFLSGGGTISMPIARPRMVTRRNESTGKTEAFFIFRDTERGSKVSMYTTRDISANTWTVRDLTDFGVNQWEPSHDTELWKTQGKLDIFVQYNDGPGAGGLSDGGNLDTGAGMATSQVYCLEAGLDQ